MKQCFAVGAVILTVAIASVQAQREQRPQGAQAGAGAVSKSSYVPPKTPWGDPDIQGGYSNVNENGIPFEKPDALGSKQIGEVDDSELAELVKDRNQRAEANAATIGGRETGAGPVHWYEHYNAKNSRAWMVVDPPDGHIPAQTPAARLRIGAGGRGGPVAAGRGAGVQEGGRADSWLDRSFYDRCITRGFPGSMMPAIYGNAYDITQAPGLVAIRYEMVHETRIIRLDTTPRTGQLSHMGEARGHWEGNTLVVETTNFDPRTAYRNGTSSMKLTERFVPVAANAIEWSMTVDDPQTWVRPWTFAMRLTEDRDQPLFEYACHEGNYAMRNILSAARAADAAAAGQASGQK
jgi:hypothetical protein